MNILHVKYAVEIAKTKSISKAAKNLYMGQPNLSRAIRELEENLGITIFKRTSKGITVTPEGEEFLEYARRIVAQVEEVEDMYKNGRKKTVRFSASVCRSSYIADAFTNFMKGLSDTDPAEIFYKETNSMKTISNIIKGDFDLGIVRYQSTFDKYFTDLFAEKNFIHETVFEFSYNLLMSKDSPLADKTEVSLASLENYTEITHADPYVPSMPIIDVKKAELSGNIDRHIYVFERASQFTLLENVPNTFMWVSPIPPELIEKYHLVQKKCPDNQKKYKDVLIYRKGHNITELENEFITQVCESKRKLESIFD